MNAPTPMIDALARARARRLDDEASRAREETRARNTERALELAQAELEKDRWLRGETP